jgi:hypothetical protein
MIEPTKQEIEQLKEEAARVAHAMSVAMFNEQCSKKASLVAAIRVAAGVSCMSGMDLHRAIHMFMTFYKEADKAFEGKK